MAAGRSVGRGHTLILNRELVSGLKELSQRQEKTLFMVLSAAFKVLLQRCTGQTDLVVGTATANRNWKEIEGLIGFFVNTLALRTDLSGDPTFLELLQWERKVTLEAYEHQGLPFGKLVQKLQPQRNPRCSPVYQVMLVHQNFPDQ